VKESEPRVEKEGSTMLPSSHGILGTYISKLVGWFFYFLFFFYFFFSLLGCFSSLREECSCFLVLFWD
jgi:hypothetical protein